MQAPATLQRLSRKFSCFVHPAGLYQLSLCTFAFTSLLHSYHWLWDYSGGVTPFDVFKCNFLCCWLWFCRESGVQVESMVTEVLGQILQEISSAEIGLERQRVADEKRTLEEARLVHGSLSIHYSLCFIKTPRLGRERERHPLLRLHIHSIRLCTWYMFNLAKWKKNNIKPPEIAGEQLSTCSTISVQHQ